MLGLQDNAELHNLLGEVDENAGDHVEAARELQRAAQMDPSEKNIFDWGNDLLLHRAYELAGGIFSRGVQLVALLQTSAKLDPKLSDPHLQLGNFT